MTTPHRPTTAPAPVPTPTRTPTPVPVPLTAHPTARAIRERRSPR
ncbi:hypothetical protein [Streptomyces cyaneogriseus]|nr:hypothetical protein [Streptomyces cyaneogriseus]